MASDHGTKKRPEERNDKVTDLHNIHLTDSDRADLRTINFALDSLLKRKIFATPDPYILTIPQDDNLRYRHRGPFQAEQFAYYTPFAKYEWENLQYQTYQYFDPGSSIYKQHVSNYSDNSETTEKPLQTPNSGRKKLISFNAYKKAKIGVSLPNNAPAEDKNQSNIIKDPAKRVKAESADILAAAQEDELIVTTTQETPEIDKQAQRPREQSPIANGNAGRKETKSNSVVDEEHDTASSEVEKHHDTADSVVKEQHSLAPPLKAEQQHKANSDYKQVGELEHVASMPPKLSPLREVQHLLPARLSPRIPHNIDAALWERKKAASKKDVKLTSTNGIDNHGFRARSASPDVSTDHDKKLEGRNRSPVVKPKLNEARDGAKVSKTLRSQINGHKSGDKRSNEAGNTRSGLKRSHEDETEDGSTKKVKTSVESPTTPAQPESLSPEVVRATPGLRKDTHTTAMQRVQSSDGMPRTPNGVVTPQAVNNHDPRTPSKIVHPKTGSQIAWEVERNKYDVLGRSLKHASQAHTRASPPETELAAVKALESMICYTLAFACFDEALAAAEPKQSPSLAAWMGLTPWYYGVRRASSQTPLLSGIAALLGLAFASRVLSVIAGGSKAQDQSTYKEYIDLMQGSSTEMSTHLSLKVVQESFPVSWHNSKASLTANKLDSASLMSIVYQLPVGVHTPPAQAALAARAILNEWLEKSKLDYKLQV